MCTGLQGCLPGDRDATVPPRQPIPAPPGLLLQSAPGCWVSLMSPPGDPREPGQPPMGVCVGLALGGHACARCASCRGLWKSAALPPLARASLGRSPIPGLEEGHQHGGGHRGPSPAVPPSLSRPAGPARSVPTGDTGPRRVPGPPAAILSPGIFHGRRLRGGMGGWMRGGVFAHCWSEG